MRIDWAQTLIGSSAPAKPVSTGGSGAASVTPDDAGACARAARLTGFLVASLFIGMAIAALPARGLAASRLDILALSGFLLANAAGLFMLSRAGRNRLRLAALAGFVPVPFLILAGVDAPIIAVLGILLLIDGSYGLLRKPSRSVTIGVLALAGCCATASGVAGLGAGAGTGYGTLALLAAALGPVAAAALWHLQPKAQTGAAHDDSARLRALLGVATRHSDRTLLVTDIVGEIDPVSHAGFERALTGELFPEGSLVTAALIADRVVLLDALSRAIHRGESSTDLTIRLRHEPMGVGYPTPPRFEPYSCNIHPVPGEAARAIVALAPLEERDIVLPPVTPLVAPASPSLPSPVLARALHDCSAPFNAGLGFLEMIADPRLAPRDIATYRDFAAEAHKAISEAHRNTVLLGHWLKLVDGQAACLAERGEISPKRLVNDAIRAMNLRDAEDRGEIRVNEPEALPVAVLPVTIARFAVEILLREAQHGGASRLAIARAGSDLVIGCSLGVDAGDPAISDAFQHAIEAAASIAETRIVFSRPDAGVRELRFKGAFAETLWGGPETGIAPIADRLAS
jgi:hypothetical protein